MPDHQQQTQTHTTSIHPYTSLDAALHRPPAEVSRSISTWHRLIGFFGPAEVGRSISNWRRLIGFFGLLAVLVSRVTVATRPIAVFLCRLAELSQPIAAFLCQLADALSQLAGGLNQPIIRARLSIAA